MPLLQPPFAVSFQLASSPKSKPRKIKMSSFEFDRVKAEKVDAQRRYNRRKNFEYCLQAVGALILLWCSFGTFTCFPEIARTVSHYLSFPIQSTFAFALVNSLILFIYLLSSTTDKNDQTKTSVQTDIYEEYVSFSNFAPRKKTTTEEEDKQLVVSSSNDRPAQQEESPAPTFDDEKQIVCCEKIDNSAKVPAKEDPVRDMTVMDNCQPAEKEEKRFRRTRSERHGKEKRDYLRELRRSETDVGRKTAVNSTAGAKSMLEMNNEEFRLTIESFIATKKMLLREESIAMLSEEREEYTAISYR